MCRHCRTKVLKQLEASDKICFVLREQLFLETSVTDACEQWFELKIRWQCTR